MLLGLDIQRPELFEHLSGTSLEFFCCCPNSVFTAAVMPSMPQMPSMDASLAWMGCDLDTEPSQNGFPDL